MNNNYKYNAQINDDNKNNHYKNNNNNHNTMNE